MRVRVRVLPGGVEEYIELSTGTVLELLRRLGMSVEDAVVVREGRPLLPDEKLGDGDSVTVYRAASGG